MSASDILLAMLAERLDAQATAWLREASGEIAGGAPDVRFATLLSAASRHVARNRERLAPTEAERAEAARVVEGWNPERWTRLEAARVVLVLSRRDLETERGVGAVEDAFRYADEGEQRALYRSLALMPAPELFRLRAQEGCRTNMRSVFEADVLDTPYPVRFFDDVAWRQAVIKCVFIEAPLWRLWGLDTRLSADLARMALDLIDERRSAHRVVQPELWAALGPYGGGRALASIRRELDAANPHTLGRRAAALALARARQADELETLRARESDPAVRRTLEEAAAGPPASTAFAALRPEEA